jgi:hypothetical protein
VTSWIRTKAPLAVTVDADTAPAALCINATTPLAVVIGVDTVPFAVRAVLVSVIAPLAVVVGVDTVPFAVLVVETPAGINILLGRIYIPSSLVYQQPLTQGIQDGA